MAYELFEDVVNAARGGDHPVLQHELPLLGKLDELQRGVVDVGLVSQLIAITINITTGVASTAIFNANAPFAFEVVDVIIQARATETSGALTITDGTNSITDAITCDTDDEQQIAATIDNDYSQIAVDGTLDADMSGGVAANMKALVTVLVIPTI